MKINTIDAIINIAVDKNNFSNLQEYISMSTKNIKSNIEDALKLLQYLPEDSLLKHHTQMVLKNTDITGSFILKELPQSEGLKTWFLESDSRMFVTEEGRYIVRGQEYLQSIDPNIRSKQKVRNMIEIIYSGTQCIKEVKINDLEENDRLWYIGLLDYIKNAYVTLFNTLIIPEKKGNEIASSTEYLKNRNMLLHHVNESTAIYYSSLLEGVITTQNMIDNKNLDICKRELETVRKYLNEKMFSRSLSRPEATHPISLLSSSGLIAERYPHVDTIIALPGGSTELGSLTKYLYGLKYKKNVDLHMLPVSFHSGKKQGVRTGNREEYFKNIVEGLDINGKEILIIDDNSSTGKTLQYVTELLQTKRPSSIIIKVMEVDVVRSTIDRENTDKRPKATNPQIYDCAVGILPVSNKLQPKVDIKEIKETKRILDYYKQLENESDEQIDRIKYALYQETITDPTNSHILNREIDFDDTQSVQEEQERNNSIVKFRGTFLSNFYPCPVEYDGIEYPSTEHAYQGAKYPIGIFEQLDDEQLDIINEKLKLKGHSITVNPGDSVFESHSFTSGNIKIISSQLDAWGYCRSDWNDIKLNVMLDVLIQKFSEPKLNKRLKETQGKYLIEGNTRDDVFWGRSNGRGNNYLGRCLMYIRDKM